MMQFGTLECRNIGSNLRVMDDDLAVINRNQYRSKARRKCLRIPSVSFVLRLQSGKQLHRIIAYVKPLRESAVNKRTASH